ncbi:hypothetical protein [Streptomyces sp. SID13588]|uniref:hypothetical protein n=1 Tax=Streptomyces sp. SID13588 TaxID=2706051 RepID=UPI0013C9CF73|nr:hypothetical protein [Streptomyces sp. SID13588]NEA72025.1 hypothetical protein [Streptomyces sp. SID13588]
MKLTRLAACGATMLALVAACVGTAAPAGATSGSCTARYEPKTYPSGYVVDTVYYCDSWQKAPVYGRTLITQHSWMYAGSNWYTCQRQDIGHQNPVTYNADGSANRNDWWLFTLADQSVDDGPGYWGYLPATYLVQGGNWQRVPGVPDC